MKEFAELKNWIINNKFKVSFIFLIYFVAIYTISIVNFPYIDDIGRKVAGFTSFGIGYSRWGSEFLSWIFQGSRHLTDTGVTNQILTAIILSITSIIALYIFSQDKKISYIAALCSTLIGLNPFFLECIGFRFDSPYMAISVFCCYFPFLFWNKKNLFILISTTSVFIMCNTYQQSSGIFIVVALSIFIYSVIFNYNLKKNMFSLIRAALSFVLAMCFYIVETKLNSELSNRGTQVQIASLNDMPKKLIVNSKIYLNEIINNSAKIWIVFYILIIVMFIIVSVLNLRNKNILNIMMVLLYAFIALFLSYGVLLIFEYPLVVQHTRYGEYGFGNYLALLMLMMISFVDKKRLFKRFINTILSLFMFYQISFSFTFAAMLDIQKETFEDNAVMLATDLEELLVKNNPSKVYFNRLFAKSAILKNAERNFPVLAKSIPSIEAIYWPNAIWFNEVTGLNIDFSLELKNYGDFPLDETKLYKDTAKYRIYSLPNIIFVEMK